MWYFLKEDSEFGSNRRRLLSNAVLILIGVLLVEAMLDLTGVYEDFILPIVAMLCLASSILYFSVVVLATLFQTDKDFRPDPHRLFIDAVISIVSSIISFALCYRYFGVVPASADTISRFDYYYFSAVTFTTLGYGDFRPSPGSRFFAGFQAIIGNLHLGVIVGAAFYAAQPRSKHQTNRHANQNDSKGK